MGVIGIEKNGYALFLAQAPHQSRDLRYPQIGTLPCRSTNDYRDLQFLRRREYSFQQNPIGNVEVTNGHPVVLRFFQYIPQWLHTVPRSSVRYSPRLSGAIYSCDRIKRGRAPWPANSLVYQPVAKARKKTM